MDGLSRGLGVLRFGSLVPFSISGMVRGVVFQVWWSCFFVWRCYFGCLFFSSLLPLGRICGVLLWV